MDHKTVIMCTELFLSVTKKDALHNSSLVKSGQRKLDLLHQSDASTNFRIIKLGPEAQSI